MANPTLVLGRYRGLAEYYPKSTGELLLVTYQDDWEWTPCSYPSLRFLDIASFCSYKGLSEHMVYP